MPFRVAGAVGVRVDAEQVPSVHRLLQQFRWRVAPLGPGVDPDRRIRLRACLEHVGRVEGDGLRPRPTMIRPVQCPRMSDCGLSIAASIRAVMAGASIRSLECTLATTTSRSASSPSSYSICR
jgi:hypothetical protein